jgi:hypothetical protein
MALLGWGGFTWKRAEDALVVARATADQIDKLELKMAERYLTKADFELSMDRLFGTLDRFEQKLDYHVVEQDQYIKRLKNKLQKDLD